MTRERMRRRSRWLMMRCSEMLGDGRGGTAAVGSLERNEKKARGEERCRTARAASGSPGGALAFEGNRHYQRRASGRKARSCPRNRRPGGDRHETREPRLGRTGDAPRMFPPSRIMRRLVHSGAARAPGRRWNPLLLGGARGARGARALGLRCRGRARHFTDVTCAAPCRAAARRTASAAKSA
jgi:hypothetical protein